jgi:hypothetical protein
MHGALWLDCSIRICHLLMLLAKVKAPAGSIVATVTGTSTGTDNDSGAVLTICQ